MKSKWPKKLAILTDKQKWIKDDFMKYWHEVLPKRYGLIEKFNHEFSVKRRTLGGRVLEIGAGLGEHIAYEDLSNTEYYALELRAEMALKISERFPTVRTIVGDCQERLNFSDKYFNTVIAIHVLEHLPNLPKALSEVRRVIKDDGQFFVVIPCEGGLAYSLARKISAQRIFEKRYQMKYDWCIGSEHINVPKEIIEELEKFFTIKDKSYFPFKLPSINANFVIGLALTPLLNKTPNLNTD